MNTEFTRRVSIINDVVTEGLEVFFMLVVSSDDRVQIRPERATVTIIDEDRKHDDMYIVCQKYCSFLMNHLWGRLTKLWYSDTLSSE